MALTKVETKVLWGGGNNSASVPANGSQTSDVITLDPTCVAARIALKADNEGTPNAADIIHFYALESMGDPDGSGADEFVTPDNGHYLGRVDTSKNDPSIRPNDFPNPQKSFKIYAEGITETTVNDIAVSATITEQRSS